MNHSQRHLTNKAPADPERRIRKAALTTAAVSGTALWMFPMAYLLASTMPSLVSKSILTGFAWGSLMFSMLLLSSLNVAIWESNCAHHPKSAWRGWALSLSIALAFMSIASGAALAVKDLVQPTHSLHLTIVLQAQGVLMSVGISLRLLRRTLRLQSTWFLARAGAILAGICSLPFTTFGAFWFLIESDSWVYLFWLKDFEKGLVIALVLLPVSLAIPTIMSRLERRVLRLSLPTLPAFQLMLKTRCPFCARPLECKTTKATCEGCGMGLRVQVNAPEQLEVHTQKNWLGAAPSADSSLLRISERVQLVLCVLLLGIGALIVLSRGSLDDTSAATETVRHARSLSWLYALLATGTSFAALRAIRGRFSWWISAGCLAVAIFETAAFITLTYATYQLSEPLAVMLNQSRFFSLYLFAAILSIGIVAVARLGLRVSLKPGWQRVAARCSTVAWLTLMSLALLFCVTLEDKERMFTAVSIALWLAPLAFMPWLLRDAERRAARGGIFVESPLDGDITCPICGLAQELQRSHQACAGCKSVVRIRVCEPSRARC